MVKSLCKFLSWVFGLAFALAVLQPLSADVVKPAFTLDGHWWQKQSKDVKLAAVQSMVDAAEYGYLSGYERGLEDAAKITSNQKSKTADLTGKFRTLKFSHPISFYVFVVDTYYSKSMHLEVPLVYVVTCMADQTLNNPTCKPYGARQPLPTPIPSH